MNKKRYVVVDESFFWDSMSRRDFKWSELNTLNKYGLGSVDQDTMNSIYQNHEFNSWNIFLYEIIDDSKFGLMLLEHSNQIVKVLEFEL